jgi:hypothetical protein
MFELMPDACPTCGARERYDFTSVMGRVASPACGGQDGDALVHGRLGGRTRFACGYEHEVSEFTQNKNFVWAKCNRSRG